MTTYNVIQHLRGTTAEWAEDDIVIPEGEIAIEKLPNRDYRFKIGNGIDTWSELNYNSQNNWKQLWNVTCDGTQRIYTFDLDSDGEPLNYTELKMIVWCQPGTSISSSIYLNSGLSAYITQNNLPYSSALVHSFHFNSIFENCYRASGVSGGLLTTQESKIINNSGSPLSVFNYIRLANTTYNYPLNTIIKIWGK